MTIGLTIAVIALFFIPPSLFGIAFYMLEDRLFSGTNSIIFALTVVILVWPAYLATLGVYFIASNNFETILPKIVIIILSILATINAMHMMYLRAGGLRPADLVIDGNLNYVTLIIMLSAIGIALLILAATYFIGFFVVRRFF